MRARDCLARLIEAHTIAACVCVFVQNSVCVRGFLVNAPEMFYDSHCNAAPRSVRDWSCCVRACGDSVNLILPRVLFGKFAPAAWFWGESEGESE